MKDTTDPEAGIRLLSFVNVVRDTQGLAPVRGLSTWDADPDDEEGCVLALAMQCAVGSSNYPEWAAAGRWVMRFAERTTAAEVAAATGASWLPEWHEVALPWAVADFAVSAHFGLVEADASGRVLSWFVPAGDEQLLEEQLLPVSPRELTFA